jgi:hypothetical protein
MDSFFTKMKEYCGKRRLAYSEYGLYTFHAQFPVPPELAIITLKRFWSGQVSTAEIMENCRRQKIPLIILPKPKITQEWRDFLNEEYTNSASDDACQLFMVKQTDGS